jgi:hypothetical protein
MASYFTGAVRFKDGQPDEFAVFPMDIDTELEDLGHMQMDYVVEAEEVVKGIKNGDMYFASFAATMKLYLIEIVICNGRESLEIADSGQPAEFRTLRNLPEPG